MAKRILVCALFLLLWAVPLNVSAQAYATKEDVYQAIKDNLLAHKAEFTIVMDKKIMNEISTNTELMDVVTAMDDKSISTDYDYLKVSVRQWKESWTYSSLGNSATLTFSVKYLNTLKQEQLLDEKIGSVLAALKLKNATDYQKVKAIHDYIIKRVIYDTSLQKHSAYNALIGKSAVCEGYSAAAYRMFTDAGIACRIITGTAGGGPHSWNIVKVNGKWYNIDLTWDDPITQTGAQVLRYDYFLKNTSDFKGHYKDAEYKTKDFVGTYPTAAKSYKSSTK